MDKSLEKKLILWLKQKKKACGHYSKLSVLFGLLNGKLLIIQAYLVAKILDGVIMEKLTIVELSSTFYFCIVTIIFRALLAYARERVSFVAGLKLRRKIRAEVLNKLTLLGPVFIKGKPAGAWASIVLEQVDNLQDFYSKYLPQMHIAVFIPLMILAVVFPLNWAAGIILLMTAPLIPLFMMMVGWGAADANRKNFSALAKLSGHFMDRLKGLRTIQLFYRGESELKSIESASEDFRSRTMSVLKLAFLNSAVLEFFAAVSIAVLAVYFGFSYLGHLNFGHYGIGMSLFTGLFILIMAPEFYQPLRDMGTHYHAKAQAVGAAEALMLLLDEPATKENAIENKAASSDEQIENAIKFEHGISIEAKNLRIFSPDGQQLVGPLNFNIAAGEHIALVGLSGAGKTSLINALLGFLPYEGALLFNGIELTALNKANLRENMAWLGQEPQLFHGSLRDNLALGRSNLTDNDIIELLNKACIGELIKKESGLDYMISENAQSLSVGQAQRVALARALAQNPSLYLLDEPTASLDVKSEQQVLQTLNNAMNGKTSLMISHRLDLLKNASQIWVMDKGEIVQKGNYAALSKKNGLFLDMLQQMEGEPFPLSEGEMQ